MDKPHSFAGRAIRKGKVTTNDYEQPEKFFADMQHFYNLLDGIPYKAIEELENYELNRDILVGVLRRLYDIFDAAKIDIGEEIKRIDSNPFDGLEEDVAMKNAIKISGEDEDGVSTY